MDIACCWAAQGSTAKELTSLQKQAHAVDLTLPCSVMKRRVAAVPSHAVLRPNAACVQSPANKQQKAIAANQRSYTHRPLRTQFKDSGFRSSIARSLSVCPLCAAAHALRRKSISSTDWS